MEEVELATPPPRPLVGVALSGSKVGDSAILENNQESCHLDSQMQSETCMHL